MTFAVVSNIAVRKDGLSCNGHEETTESMPESWLQIN